MRLFPKIPAKTFDAVLAFCLGIEKQRAEDVAEMATLGRLCTPVQRLAAALTAVGNVGSGEDDLISYTLPDGTLTRDGEYFEFGAAVVFAANANNKRLKAKLGASTIYDSTALAINDGEAYLHITVIRTGAAAQKCVVTLISNNATLPITCEYTETAESLAASVALKLTGEATSNDDIVQKYLTAKWYPASIENA